MIVAGSRILMIQGTLLVTLQGQQNLPEHDLGGLAGQFGDIKSVHPARFPEYVFSLQLLSS